MSTSSNPNRRPSRPVIVWLLAGVALSRALAFAGVLTFAGVGAVSGALRRRRGDGERGQAMTEYVLLLLGVAAIALLVTGWAARTGKVGELLDRVFDAITGRVA